MIDPIEVAEIVEATTERLLTDSERQKLHDAMELALRLGLIGPETNETSAALFPPEKQPKSSAEKPGAKRPGRRGRDDFPGAKVVPVPHEDLQTGQMCRCGKGRLYPLKRPVYFRHFVGQAPIQVTIYEQQQLRCSCCSEVFTAELPSGVGPEPYEASAVSTIALAKYGLGTPFYRQAQCLVVMGTPIAASVQYAVVEQAWEKLLPVQRHLIEQAAAGKVGYFDDTSVKILQLERPENDHRTGVFTTGIVSVHDDFQIALFFSGRNHAGENRAELLEKRSPNLPGMIQMSDALASNCSKIETAQELIAYCLAHGRRNFVKILDSFPEECRRVLGDIARVYHNDSLSRQQNHTPAERLAFHQQNSGPVLRELKAWLDEQMEEKKAEPNSSLGKAIQYLRNHWEPLTLFLRVEEAPLDNNVVERALKKVVLHRKNSLFYRTAQGALVGDLYLSLIQTCQLNRVNPHDYLTQIQRNHQEAALRPAEWMPWTYQKTLTARDAPVPA